MKKLICFFLAITLLLSFAACDSDSDSDFDSSTKKSTKSANRNSQVTFDGQTVVDNDICLIEVSSVKLSGKSGGSLKLLLENHTSDKSLNFQIDHLSINGVTYTTYLYETLAAGKKTKATIDLTNETLDKLIGDYTDIHITFYVQDNAKWDRLLEETVHIYPYGEEKATRYEREAQRTDAIVLDGRKATVIVTDCESRSADYPYSDGYYVCFYAENHTEETINFFLRDVSVNDYMVETYLYDQNTIAPGESAFFTMCCYEASLEKNDIDDVEIIEFTLSGSDDDYHDVIEKTVAIKP